MTDIASPDLRLKLPLDMKKVIVDIIIESIVLDVKNSIWNKMWIKTDTTMKEKQKSVGRWNHYGVVIGENSAYKIAKIYLFRDIRESGISSLILVSKDYYKIIKESGLWYWIYRMGDRKKFVTLVKNLVNENTTNPLGCRLYDNEICNLTPSNGNKKLFYVPNKVIPEKLESTKKNEPFLHAWCYYKLISNYYSKK